MKLLVPHAYLYLHKLCPTAKSCILARTLQHAMPRLHAQNYVHVPNPQSKNQLQTRSRCDGCNYPPCLKPTLVVGWWTSMPVNCISQARSRAPDD
jgi:hypothetical protein